jgi:hypothetical protein
MAGRGVHDADAEHGQGPVEGRRRERRAVVDEYGRGHAGRLQPSTECRLQTHGVLAVPQRQPGTARLQSSMKANRTALPPSSTGPCNPSPVHSSPNWFAWKRPSPLGGSPSGRVSRPRRVKCRCRVRSETLPSPASVTARATWTAVRRGASRLSVTAASSSLAGVRLGCRRTTGTSASKPPRSPGAQSAAAVEPDRLSRRRERGSSC